MKNFILSAQTLCALLIAGAAFTACSSDDHVLDDSSVENPTTQKYTMTVNASKGGDATTRALTLGRNDADTKNVLNATWDANEVVLVYQGGLQIGTLYSAASTTNETSLTGTLESAPDAGQDLTLYFHTATDPATTIDAYDGQDGTLATIASSYDFCAPATITAGSFTVSGSTVSTTGSVSFGANQQSVVKFTLKDKANDAAISPSALTVTDGTSTVSLTIPDATYSTNGDGVLYVAFPAAGSSKTITLTATVGDDSYTYTTSSAKTFVNGQYYEITVKMTKQVITDLSMVDCAGNDRASRWTANCYMVHTAGNYKLPLVYGNAIKNGAANTLAYKPGEMTTSNPYCANFVNHAGDAISAPWITKSTSGEGVNKGMGIAVKSAELLWQDAKGLVTAVGISGDYLTLTVGKDADTQEGNALVAAKDADGIIVWSWHIWVTKQTFNNLTEIAAVTSTTPSTSHTYQLTPVNLGWVGDATSGATGYCTFYQWGRKDAFIPSTGEGNTNHTVYDINNNDVTTTAFTNTKDKTVTIGGNIQQPTVHNYNNSTQSPCNTQYFNMWDAQKASNTIAAAATVKTVYDPCPPGFCVPTMGLYNYIKDQTRPAFNKGYTYSGVFFPASGFRGNDSGGLSNVGEHGSYWSATPGSQTNGRDFYFKSSIWNQGNDYRACGYPVRAVSE